MKKKFNFKLLFAFLLIFAFFFVSGGCGGGGGGEPGAAEPTPETVEGDFLPLTEEKLAEIVEASYMPVELNELIFEDGTNITDYLSTSELNSSSEEIHTQNLGLAYLRSIQAKMLKRAWEFIPHFSPLTPTEHVGTVGTGTAQQRYVYVWGGKFKDTLEVQSSFPDLGGCGHGMFGGDCSGLIYRCALAAGIEGFPEGTAHVQSFEETWNTKLQASDIPLIMEDVSTEIGNQPPQVGDIILWNSGSGTRYYHIGIVGLAGGLGDHNNPVSAVPVVISSVGVPNYSCEKYEDWVLNRNRLIDSVNSPEYQGCGPTALRYDKLTNEYRDEIGFGYGTENRRLRLRVDANAIDVVADIILTWGASPYDLDSHIVGTNADATEMFHVYFNNQTHEDAMLDIDDTSAFGPEIVTLNRLKPGALYRYYVHNYSDSYYLSTTLASSGAKVVLGTKPGSVSNVNQTLSFTVPEGTGPVWHVFNIIVDTDGNGTLETVNRILPSFYDSDNAMIMHIEAKDYKKTSLTKPQ